MPVPVKHLVPREDRDSEPSLGSAAGALRPGRRQRASSIRSMALTGLFILAVFYTLYFARLFLLPVVVAVLLNLLLAPVIQALTRIRIPPAVGAGIVVLALLGVIGGSGYLLVGPTTEWLNRAPTSFARIEEKLEQLRQPVERVNRATQDIQKLAGGGSAARQEGTEVTVRRQSLPSVLFESATAIVTGLAVTLVLLYFLLASGDLFLRKLIRVLPTLDDKKRAVDIANQLQSDISLYLSTITVINIVLGIAVGLAMHLLGMPNPMLWGVMATVLNFIPYMGAIVGILVIAVVAALTFTGVGAILLPPLAYFGLTATEGYFVTPLVLGRRLTLNPVMILLGLIFWGWLWGVLGAVLAVPMLASFKIFCDHIKPLEPIGEFLGS
ncbi:MAG TPA: AI-2E family transporter [Thermoanaerobaculia bacterium]|nr:AI-2E family transporter [Thermoanaerobaculia bacterium]